MASNHQFAQQQPADCAAAQADTDCSEDREGDDGRVDRRSEPFRSRVISGDAARGADPVHLPDPW